MTTLVHLSKDGNFQTRTEATVIGCNVVDDGDDKDTGGLVVEIQLDITSMHPQGEVSNENSHNQIKLFSPASP